MSIEFSKAILFCHEKSQSPMSKSLRTFSIVPSFSKIFSTPRINKMINKESVDERPSPLRIKIKDVSPHIPVNSLGRYLSPEYLLNVLSNLSNLEFHFDWKKFSNLCC